MTTPRRAPALAWAACLALAAAPRPAAGAPAADPGPSLLQAEQPDVQEGNRRLGQGDAAEALKRYDAAERALGPRAEIDFDRGNALHAQGRHAEARQAWQKALEADAKGRGALSSRSLQNMGNALEAAGDREGAVRSFSEALRRDPANEDARYNLEVLLRRKADGRGAPRDPGDAGPQQQQGPSQQGEGTPPPEGGKPGQQGQAGQDQQAGQAPQPAPEPKPGDGKDEERREGEAGAKQQADQQGQAGETSERSTGEGRGEARAGDLDRREAERLLDALRSRERPMPLGPEARKDARRRDVEKDW